MERLTVERIGVVQAQVQRYEGAAAVSERSFSESTGTKRDELRRLSSLLRNVVVERKMELELQRNETAHISALRRHYQLLEAKYRRVAFQPWLAAEADPPLPE
jgi:hypothetical protein